MHCRWFWLVSAAALAAALSLAGSCFAQNSDFNLSAHANGHATAKDIGLPEYPGAKPYKDKDSDSSSADLGFALNSFHFSMQVASYVTTDSPEQVLAFYRKPLAKFGDVLECDHGKAVGALTVTKSGLTCGDQKNGHMSVNGSDSDHELRAGTPERFRIVGIDTSESGQTKFGLVALVLPKNQ
jgi:endonuclease YncB( thermonuclease family)